MHDEIRAAEEPSEILREAGASSPPTTPHRLSQAPAPSELRGAHCRSLFGSSLQAPTSLVPTRPKL